MPRNLRAAKRRSRARVAWEMANELMDAAGCSRSGERLSFVWYVFWDSEAATELWWECHPGLTAAGSLEAAASLALYGLDVSEVP